MIARTYIKKYLWVFFIAIAIILPLTPIQAHELLPKKLLEYTKSHPNATQAEIEAYLNSNPDLYQENLQQKTRILESIRNPQGGFFHNAWDFIQLGVQHILSGPDHILFVISLVLVFVSIPRMLQLTSAFTIAHSITLILAGSNILTLSSRIVEPMIALSIAYMAITTVFLRNKKIFGSSHNKVGIVFFFGLFHGLGFAGLLRELGIPEGKFITSLLSFNIGIELGQLIILALVIPLIYLLRNKKWYPRAIQIVAIAISILGLFWAIQRIIG